MQSVQRLEGKSAVVTGASDGIGLAIAREFLRQGARVWLVARQADKLAHVAADLQNMAPARVEHSSTDLSDPAAISELAHIISTQWEQVDILVNNAGIARFTPFENTPHSELQAQVQINLLAPYLLTQALLPQLIAARGNVINISSTSAHRLIPGRPASVYAMTKGGVNSLTKALALELGPQGVRVNAIAPGTVKTPLTRDLIASFSEARKAEYEKFVQTSFALGRLGEPDDVAQLAVYLASEEAKWTTGSIMILDGGLSTN